MGEIIGSEFILEILVVIYRCLVALLNLFILFIVHLLLLATVSAESVVSRSVVSGSVVSSSQWVSRCVSSK